MTDYKVIKPVATSVTGTSSAIGSFPAPVAVGQPVSASISSVGVLFVTFTNPGGSLGVTVAQDQTASPALLPVGTFVNTIFRTTLPTYTNGQAGVLNIDKRGRLLTSTINPSSGGTASVDDAGFPASVPVIGTYSLYNFYTTLPTYANGDAVCPQSDSRGRLIITQKNPTTGAITDVNAEATTAPVAPTGTWGMGIYRTVLPTYTNGQASVFHTSINGELLVSQAAPTTSAVTSVAAAAADTTLLVLNATRKGASIFNDSPTATLYLKLGTAASLTSFTTKVGPGGFYEVPSPVYTGAINGIWDAAVGNARVTEITP